MPVLVYLPLVASVLAALSARRVAARTEPRVATWLLTASAVLLAAASDAALAAVGATAAGQFRPLATVGGWSVRALRRTEPVSLSVAAPSGIVLVACVVMLVHLAVRQIRALRDGARTVRRLPGRGELALLDDPVPEAYALPGAPGRIVVSTGMLRALRPDERRAVLAHERAHLACRHHRFMLAVQIAAAANPLLLPVVTVTRFTIERWADEAAARAVGDRGLVARTIGKAALLSRTRERERSSVALAVGTPAAPSGRVRLGPVPRRVAALVTAPPGPRIGLLVFAALVVIVASAAALRTWWDVDVVFDLARLAHQRGLLPPVVH